MQEWDGQGKQLRDNIGDYYLEEDLTITKHC